MRRSITSTDSNTESTAYKDDAGQVAREQLVESLIVLDDGVNLLDRRCQGSAALYGFSFSTSQQYLCDATRDCDGLIRTSRTRSPCKKLKAHLNLRHVVRKWWFAVSTCLRHKEFWGEIVWAGFLDEV